MLKNLTPSAIWWRLKHTLGKSSFSTLEADDSPSDLDFPYSIWSNSLAALEAANLTYDQLSVNPFAMISDIKSRVTEFVMIY